jgi:hypothetical protein
MCFAVARAGSYRTIPKLSSNVTVAPYTPGTRFKATRAVVGHVPQVIPEMWRRAVAVSANATAAATVDEAVASEAAGLACRDSHSGHKIAAPATVMRPIFNAASMILFSEFRSQAMSPQDVARPPRDKQHGCRDDGAHPKERVYPAYRPRRSTRRARLTHRGLEASYIPMSISECADGQHDERRPPRFECSRDSRAANANQNRDERPHATEGRADGGGQPARSR